MNITQPPSAQPSVWVSDPLGGVGVGAVNYFNIPGSLVEATIESVGPTGSGADNIYTGLDDIPIGLDWIAFKALITLAKAAGQSRLDVNARQNGSTASMLTPWAPTALGNFRAPASAQLTYWSTTLVIPVDAANIFDLRWQGNVNDNQTFQLMPIGYGINGDI